MMKSCDSGFEFTVLASRFIHHLYFEVEFYELNANHCCSSFLTFHSFNYFDVPSHKSSAKTFVHAELRAVISAK